MSGVGRTKLDRYGADVLALCAGEVPGSDLPGPTRISDDGDGLFTE